MPSRRIFTWAIARAVILGVGLMFVAVSVGTACLDYAGEELMRVCPDGGSSAASTGTPGSGSGSGSILGSITSKDDCDAGAASAP